MPDGPDVIILMTDEERAVLNRLWMLVNDRLNYLTPTIKPIGYGSSRDGRRRRARSDDRRCIVADGG